MLYLLCEDLATFSKYDKASTSMTLLHLLINRAAVLAALVTVVLLGVSKLLRVGRRKPGLPPGPPTIPVLGNLHQIPLTGLHRKFRDWALEYGKIFSLKLGPTTVIVLADREAVHRLIVERGAKYSGRREGHVTLQVTRAENISMVDDTRTWREKRKLISHYLSPKQLDEKHYKVQEAEATVLMNNLLERPEDFYEEIRRYTASVITSLTFGYRAKDLKSFWAKGVYESLETFSRAFEAGAMPPFDEFPFLKWIPNSIAPWGKKIREARESMWVWDESRKRLDARRALGERRNCVGDEILDSIDKKKDLGITDYGITLTFGEFVGGGADTTASQLQSLILAFAKYPEVQEKARTQIDAVCGTRRAPLWTDFQDLPYINQIVKEGMRWRPVATSAIPHRLKEDDEYMGYLLPKDSLVFIPTWAIHHNSSIYTDPDKFDPERYRGYNRLANDYAGSPDFSHRDHYGYGAGRRICPGIHLAERNMWRIAAKLLWAFEFSQPIDKKTGQALPIDDNNYMDGILTAPYPFKVGIKPRSQAHVETIRAEMQNALSFLEQFEE
ncbi:putative cytochrome P450 oxidoreductase [Paraphoma chrysanthemicola]|uniref:Cytochrome P450 oxidoreductase n=1 Tax=Paraphoma chrysanthemicola TaxID=798071 RepID=A0A8K0VT06_9PLEO|nr:putative cytochrome P450 oxidoreductase [Paraphoma chrysanthemicola]